MTSGGNNLNDFLRIHWSNFVKFTLSRFFHLRTDPPAPTPLVTVKSQRITWSTTGVDTRHFSQSLDWWTSLTN